MSAAIRLKTLEVVLFTLVHRSGLGLDSKVPRYKGVVVFLDGNLYTREMREVPLLRALLSPCQNLQPQAKDQVLNKHA